jgi:acetyl esterase/lipase
MKKVDRRTVMAAAALSTMGSMLPGSTSPFQSEVLPGDPEGRRQLLYRLLGDLPPRNRPLSAKTIWQEEKGNYVLEKLSLDLNGIEEVPAYLVRPARISAPVPAVLYNHSHGGGYKIGKEEFLQGREYLSSPPYAEVIAELGWVGLCIDSWVFGERSHTSELDVFKAMLWQGQVLWGMMVYDSIRALDYLVSRPEVDANRVATLGISMGSTMAWWLAALDPRVKVTVDICCLTDFQSLLRRKALSEHGVYYYVPGLLKYFSTAEINALIAPRPHLGVAGRKDSLTPPEGLDVIEQHLNEVYGNLGVAEHWKLLRYDVAHQETPEARHEIRAFLERFI